MSKILKLGPLKLKADDFLIMAGPCVIEDRNFVLETAQRLQEIAAKYGFPYVFKSSYDKANRTSIESFRGVGMDEGLKILQEVKTRLNLPVVSDVHSAEEATIAGEVLDVLQIPAFLCRQTDLLIAAGKTGKVVNIKKGQFLAPWDMEHVAKKVSTTGNQQLMLTERGASFGYNNLVSDMRSLLVMGAWGYRVIFDATHSVQLPGGGGPVSSGQREYVLPLARGAVAVGCDGLFLEVHPNPKEAPSDGPNMLDFAGFDRLLLEIKTLLEALSPLRAS